MHVYGNGTRLWFDVEGPALVPDGREMRERPTVLLLHGGPGSFDNPDQYWPLLREFVSTACTAE